MFSTKIRLAAAALAVLSVAGIGSAGAAPWDHRDDRRGSDARVIDRHDDHRDNRFERRHEMGMHRNYVDRMRVNEVLRMNHYRVIGDPYFVHDRYVVRTHNRFGRIVLVQIDPYSGAFLGEIRL